MLPRHISPRKALACKRQPDGQRHPDINLEAEERQAEIDEEQLHQQRRALEDLDVGRHQGAQPSPLAGAPQCNCETERTAEGKGEQGEDDRPAGAFQQEQKLCETKITDHRFGLTLSDRRSRFCR